jgi:arylsulfatase A-like enzyme
MDAYDGAISFMDDAIGRLMADLEKLGMAKNLLLIVLSDHGEAFGEHGLIEHRHSLYREEIHVPLIFWWPKHVPGGSKIDRPVSTAALPATVLDLIGAGEQTMFPGPSLSQLWNNPAEQADWTYPLSELAQISFEPPPNPNRYGAMEALMTPNYHYIVHQKFGEGLFDWKSDPGELHNLINMPVGQAVARELALQLKSQLARHAP